MKTGARFRGLTARLDRDEWLRAGAEQELPLRAELFSADRLEEHGRALATRHILASRSLPDSLLARLGNNEHALVNVSALLTAAVTEKRLISPAGEWLLDNFYLIEEQIRTARRHLPEGYSRILPRLENATLTPATGAPPARRWRPRVYDIALEIISHGDGRFDPEVLARFIAAYQTVKPLQLGELWATPIMLRLATIENLRRVAVGIAVDRIDRNLASFWADQLTDAAENDPRNLILVIADMARAKPPLAGIFVAELTRRLQGRGPALAMPLVWIEQQLSVAGQSIEHVVQAENQQQAADQVSISNSIASLRMLEALDWRDFVESLSLVEQTLKEDPADVHARMDFATRDSYRHVVERIARRSACSEVEVARQAIALATAASSNNSLDSSPSAPPNAQQNAANGGQREQHVGYYLIDQGLAQLQQAVSWRPPIADSIRKALARAPLAPYLGAILLISLATAAAFWQETGGTAAGTAGVIAALALLAGSQLAVALVNWLATLLVRPQALPRMDFAEQIPPAARTLVVVPTLLSSPAGVDRLLEELEIRFLGNRDERLHFGLLTDFADAAEASLPGDEALVQRTRAGIEALNRRYGNGVEQNWDDIFFLFHRPRLWNARENVWMGRERKRGKLADLNALLRGDHELDAAGQGANAGISRFALVVGDLSILPNIKYVITLDTDTQLPRDAARQLIGAMAHPLNQPQYDPERGRIVAGYGILQPRVASSLAGAARSRYARLHAGDAGIDPYTRAVSDVYQDLFGEGSFIGKGIYDVDAFEQSLDKGFPDNLILSHDLLEGCYARSGLLSDVDLYEEYPARYSADVSRRHRWIRGDWQIAGWLWPRVPVLNSEPAAGEAPSTLRSGRSRSRNPLSLLSRWKLFDNLRRSLIPAALTALLIIGWLAVESYAKWTLSVLAIYFVPPLLVSTYDLVRRPDDARPWRHLVAVAVAAMRRLKQIIFELACLPYEAFYSLDAIVRTAWRMLITRRRLLEWQPSSDAAEARQPTGATTGKRANKRDDRDDQEWQAMWIAPLIAVLLIAWLATTTPKVLGVALPILLLWLASPALAWWVSRPLPRRKATLSGDQITFLRTLARRIWDFFETFVGPEDNWLPPDNFQQYRIATVAHRTSPTNMGLALLANLTAYDFGYIPSGVLLERTQKTLETMTSLPRYRRHFYNWYDTRTLQPLLPLYVSTVDSGNLAGHLLTLRAGLLALPNERTRGASLIDGLSATLAIFEDERADERADESGDRTTTDDQVRALRQLLEAARAAPPATLREAHALLLQLTAAADDLATQCRAQAGSPPVHSANTGATGATSDRGASRANPQSEAVRWAHALLQQSRAALEDLAGLAPWLAFANLSDAFAESGVEPVGQTAGLPTLRELAAAGSAVAGERLALCALLAQQCAELADLDYDFLFDKSRQLLTIGYNVDQQRRDLGYYDLLASEARLCCFVAIAQNRLPQANWFALGRLLTATSGGPVLLSWSGSMFEYLMPLLVMPTYDNTLLEQTCQAAVARQIEYGEQRGVPWGISESGYNTVDLQFNYQYRAFGAPGLGLKRGLSEDLVIAPYASVMALMVAPEEACHNLQRMAGDGFLGRFGFYEAIDFTAARQRRGETRTVILSFMAHHQGMSLLALAYLLLDRPMQRRFVADPQLRAVLPLLQERIPKATTLFEHTAQLAEMHALPEFSETPVRIFNTPDTPTPEVKLLSNGRYHVMVTNAGGGYSRWKDLAVTRWREDATRDNWGTFCYLRDVTGGPQRGERGDIADQRRHGFWSTAYQPTLQRPESYEAIFSEGRAEFRRRDPVAAASVHGGSAGSSVSGVSAVSGYIETHTEIVVSPEDDIELRRTRVTNRTRQRRVIEITSYAEVALAPPAADALHPAFSKLFVQTEIVDEHNAILCTRRPRSQDEQTPWMLHQLIVHGVTSLAVGSVESVESVGSVESVEYETDRARFIGRGRSSAAPLAMVEHAPLSGSAGSVLDPVVAIRYRLTLEPEERVTIDLVSGMAQTRDEAMNLVVKYQDRHLADRVFDMAWMHSQVILRQLNASEAEAQLHARLASCLLYANPGLRPEAGLLLRNRRGQSGLWGYAISGDLPIVLLRIGDVAHLNLVRQLVQAHAYWRLKGLDVDLVIWNEDHGGYRQRLQDQIMGLISSSIEVGMIDKPGGIFVRVADQIAGDDRILFQSVARAILIDSRGTIEQQLDDRWLNEARPPRFVARAPRRTNAQSRAPAGGMVAPPELILTNGLGGFTPDGREYVITLAPGVTTPAPWANVLANPFFGTIVSESGSAYTWGDNAHEFRLTPWHNDPVSDPGGEAIYLRDQETGAFWSPTPLPAPAAATYVIRHGFGYSVFESVVDGIHAQLWVYVALDAPVKFSLLKLHNRSGRPRQLAVTGYVEWVLGDLPARSVMHVTTEVDAATGAVVARNAYSPEFSDRLAFFDVDDRTRTLTADRSEFLGRNGTPGNPAAMRRVRLSGSIGAGFDPCAALQVNIALAEGQEREIVFRLGVGVNADEVAGLVPRMRGSEVARATLEAVRAHWLRTLDCVRIETPDPALDVLANGWLVYQTLACRVWARSGYYQSGGAFGFRDQLQDVMALVHAEPQRVREHLLLCASRQFVEGDVQHWWHPPSGRGVRTRCSDDYLWLPLAVARYVATTGDRSLLQETVGFLDGPQVQPGAESYYDLPGHAAEVASVYEHCARAVKHGLRFGERGLPLIGSGDWNDGMNLVGIDGKGESVWLGFFLCDVLRQFSALADEHGDTAFADSCRQQESRLRRNIDTHAWDGAWYRRAWFDDGTPLGSASNDECRIDSISQSWSVLSVAPHAAGRIDREAADREAVPPPVYSARSRAAMKAVDQQLVRRDHALIQLLDPPFDKSGLDPGYIRGYVPGVRENGGQYTHAAVWATMAFAALDDHQRAWELMGMINPINHARSEEDVSVYKVEPYVITADIYGVAPHTGRGGWSWYTGSAGWTYRLIVESLLGLTRAGGALYFSPCVPPGWPEFKIHYRYRETMYHVELTQASASTAGAGRVLRLAVDGVVRDDRSVPLVDDRRTHRVEILLNPSHPAMPAAPDGDLR